MVDSGSLLDLMPSQTDKSLCLYNVYIKREAEHRHTCWWLFSHCDNVVSEQPQTSKLTTAECHADPQDLNDTEHTCSVLI